MKILLTFLLFLYAGNALPQNISVELLPGVKIYKPYYADALAHQFSLSKHLETVEWFGNIGNAFALADIQIDSFPIQLSAAATGFSTIIKTPGHIQVYTIDYLVDFYADASLGERTVIRFLMGHLSAHYADDGITELKNFPINYVRDYVGVHCLYNIDMINGRVYSGFNYHFHNEPVSPQYILQAGIEAEKSLSGIISAYAAVDLKYKSEVNLGTTQSYQFGLKINSSSENALRVAYTHRRGFEERGQLFENSDVKNTLGFYLDF